jgi:hypothetical protein
MDSSGNEHSSISILDSALLIGIVSGLSYWVGSNLRVRAAEAQGIPAQLLPRVDPAVLILLGVLHLVLLAAVLLLIYFLWYGATQSRSQRVRQFAQDFSNRVNLHKPANVLLFTLMVITVLYVLSQYVPAQPPPMEGSDIVSLRVRGDDKGPPARKFVYMWRDSGFLVLKDKTSGELIVLNEQDIKAIVLAPLRR